MKTIYLDNAATTQVDSKIIKEMGKYFSRDYGNASSLHDFGRVARKAIENAREVIAKSINAQPEEIFFTSGGTESNNWAIKGLAQVSNKKHIITTKIEHDCILNSCKSLMKQEYKVTYLDVDKEGFIDLKQLERQITSDTLLVSIIHGNNEIGTIQDLEKIGKICRSRGVYFHTDACQSFTKTDLDVNKMNLDLVSLNAHKLHGPKGVGALYIREGTSIGTLMDGGGQEKGRRSGTENVPGIVGFARAIQLMSKKDLVNMKRLQDKLIAGLLKIEKTSLNGPRENRLVNNVNVRFEGIEGESILLRLDQEGIAVSTGSACSNKSLEPSHVLLAIGIPAEHAHGSIRVSLSKFNTQEEINKFLKIIPQVVERLRKISPFWKE